MQTSICCICGTSINDHFWACEACERAYKLDVPFAQWPEWAKMLKADEQKRRRRAMSQVEIISASDLLESEARELDILLYGEYA